MLTILISGGMAIAVSICMILGKYLYWHHGFDRFHADKEEIFRIAHSTYHQGTKSSASAMTVAGLPVLAKERMPSVKDYVRFGPWIANDVVIRREANLFRGSKFFFADASFFQFFSFKLERGDPTTALKDPNSLVLTRTSARQLFGEDDPMGKEVLFENFKPMVVTGIAADPPVRSHLQFEMLASLSTMQEWNLDVYGDQQYLAKYIYAYLKIRLGADPSDLSKDLTSLLSQVKSSDGGEDHIAVQALTDIQLFSNLENELGQTGRGENHFVLLMVLMLIMLMAWLNHFNITSASAIEHTSALSVRRLIGARKVDLYEVATASALFPGLLGLVCGVTLAYVLEPIFGRIFSIEYLTDPDFRSGALVVSALIAGVLTIGTILVSLLPSLLISYTNANPTGLALVRYNKGLALRRGLVVFQFSLIVTLVLVCIFVHRQIAFLQNQDLGMDLDRVIALRAPLGTHYEHISEEYPAFRNAISALPEVESFAASNKIPGEELDQLQEVTLAHSPVEVGLFRNNGEVDFLSTYGIPFIAKDSSLESAGRGRSIILNRRAASVLGFSDPQDALGQQMSFWGNTELQVKGVIDDYRHQSPHQAGRPIVYDASQRSTLTDGYYSLRLHAQAKMQTAMEKIKSIYTLHFPNSVYEVIEVPTYYDRQYSSDNIFKDLALGLTLLAVIIGSMGLLGLCIIAVGQRTKEVSVRKILGASVRSIFFLLSREFLILVLASMLIGSPLAYLLVKLWLENYHLQVSIEVAPFFFTLVGVIVLSLLTVGYQSLKVAFVQPADVLREL